MDQLTPDTLSVGYHGQQMWISQQLMKNTKSEKPKPGGELASGDGEKVDKLFLQGSLQTFPGTSHYREIPQSSPVIRYSIFPCPNRNAKHIRFEPDIPQGPALLIPLEPFIISALDPY